MLVLGLAGYWGTVMKLLGNEFKRLHAALIGGFNRSSLEYLVRTSFDTGLDAIVSDGNLNQTVSGLISWAEQGDRVLDLIEAARAQNPTNADLQRLAQDARSWSSLKLINEHHAAEADSGRVHSRTNAALIAAAVIGIAVAAVVYLGPWTPASEPDGSAAVAPLSPDCPAPPLFDAEIDLDAQMVHIPSGQFIMGDNSLAGQEEFLVSVPAFEMDKHEVTNTQYSRFIAASDHAAPEGWPGVSYPPGSAFRPVTNVTWDDAQAYCQWVDKRLPTEAQWEYACRGGDSFIYPWGNEWNPAAANTESSACDAATSVGSYLPLGASIFGVADLVGNVEEWISSRYTPYPYSVLSESKAADGADIHSIRGGSWASAVPQAQCAIRANAPHEAFFETVGFRCVRSSS